jgi:predicted outer membrane protein
MTRRLYLALHLTACIAFILGAVQLKRAISLHEGLSMNVHSTAVATTLLAAAATLATAQTQGPTSPQTRLDPNAASSAHQSQAFAATATQEGMIEVALGGLPLQKSSNNQVKQFAQRMVQDHGQENQELQSIVKRKGLSEAYCVSALANEQNRHRSVARNVLRVAALHVVAS